MRYIGANMKHWVLGLGFATVLLSSPADAAGPTFSLGYTAGLTADLQTVKAISGDDTKEVTTQTNSQTLGLFADYTWVEATILLAPQYGTAEARTTLEVGGDRESDEAPADTRALAAVYRLLGRYPFEFGPVAVYPLAGAEYSQNLLFRNKKSLGTKAKAGLNDVFLDFGAGGDLTVHKKLYLRFEVLFGLNLTPENQTFQDTLAAGVEYTDFGFRAGGSLALGYRF